MNSNSNFHYKPTDLFFCDDERCTAGIVYKLLD